MYIRQILNWASDISIRFYATTSCRRPPGRHCSSWLDYIEDNAIIEVVWTDYALTPLRYRRSRQFSGASKKFICTPFHIGSTSKINLFPGMERCSNRSTMTTTRAGSGEKKYIVPFPAFLHFPSFSSFPCRSFSPLPACALLSRGSLPRFSYGV